MDIHRKTRFILASQSENRQRLFRDAGLIFEISVSRIDEHTIKESLLSEGASARDIADVLAESKALRVSRKNPEALVIGSDQVLEFEGALISKPTSIANAKAQLLSFRGKQHNLFSAAVIAKDGTPIWRHISQAKMSVRNFSEKFLDEYLERIGYDVMTTVGGYKIEEEGVRLFSRIEGDYFAILGLPLLELINYLTDAGELTK